MFGVGFPPSPEQQREFKLKSDEVEQRVAHLKESNLKLIGYTIKLTSNTGKESDLKFLKSLEGRINGMSEGELRGVANQIEQIVGKQIFVAATKSLYNDQIEYGAHHAIVKSLQVLLGTKQLEADSAGKGNETKIIQESLKKVANLKIGDLKDIVGTLGTLFEQGVLKKEEIVKVIDGILENQISDVNQRKDIKAKINGLFNVSTQGETKRRSAEERQQSSASSGTTTTSSTSAQIQSYGSTENLRKLGLADICFSNEMTPLKAEDFIQVEGSALIRWSDNFESFVISFNKKDHRPINLDLYLINKSILNENKLRKKYKYTTLIRPDDIQSSGSQAKAVQKQQPIKGAPSSYNPDFDTDLLY